MGWQDGVSDTVIIGLDSDFTSNDPQLAIWEFDTDGSGVTSSTDKRTLGEPSVGGITYVQSSEPSSPESGQNWYDTDTGIYRAYADLGSGADWHPIPPVQVLEEASTFAESDVTVTHNNTTVSNESIELSGTQTSGDALVEWDSGVPTDIKSYDLATFQATDDGETVTVDVVNPTIIDVVVDDFEDGDITVKSADWSGWNGDTADLSAQTNTVISGTYTGQHESSNGLSKVDATRGTDITGNVNIEYRIGSDAGATNDSTQIVFKTDGGTLVGYLRFTDGGGNVAWAGTEVLASWSADTTYSIEFDWDFDNGQVDIIIDGTNEGTYALSNSVSGYGFIGNENDTGNSTATRSAYIDDLTVDESSHADLFSDIGQNFDISTVDTTKEVKLRANLSRTDTANNPTVDYLTRRFTR